jgi:hypothetical protein
VINPSVDAVGQSTDPDFEEKKNRVLEFYDIADGEAKPKRGDPKIVICMDEFGPLWSDDPVLLNPPRNGCPLGFEHEDPTGSDQHVIHVSVATKVKTIDESTAFPVAAAIQDGLCGHLLADLAKVPTVCASREVKYPRRDAGHRS